MTLLLKSNIVTINFCVLKIYGKGCIDMGRTKVVEYYNERYKGSLDENVCDILEQLYEADVVPDLRHCIYELSDDDVEKIIYSMESYGVYPDGIDKKLGTLDDMQTVGVAFMYWAGKCILGDSVGLGKTVQVSGLINLLKMEYEKRGEEFHVLYLTEGPLFDSDDTRHNLIKFTGDYWYKLAGVKTANQKWMKNHPNGIDSHVIAPHSLLKQDLFASWMNSCDEIPFDMIVVDESSVLGNTKTEITKQARILLKVFNRIIFLNATPFESKLSVFYSQLSLVDEKLLPTKSNFEKEYVVFDYTGMYPRPSGRYKNAEQFRKLVGYRYFARTRRENGAVMEDCDFKVFLSELTSVQKDLLKKTHLNQMVFDYPTYFDSFIEFDENNVPKLADLLSIMNNQCKEAETVIIFTVYKEYQEPLVDWLNMQGWSSRVMNGETKKEERKEIVSAFKNKQFRVLITNVQKGLNFGNCDYCIFYSYNPNPNKMIQMEGRITRSFDIIGKNVYLLCSKGQEYATLNKRVRERAKASAEFSKADLSCIMELLLGGDNE